MLVEIPMALILAVLVNNARLRGGKFFRVVFFLPSVFSIAVVGLIFSILFSAFNGIVNAVLWELGIINRNISWFGDKTHAMFVIMSARQSTALRPCGSSFPSLCRCCRRSFSWC